MQLNDKIALVTGGSSGIGKAIARSLIDQGCTVIATYNTQEPKENDKNFIFIKADFHKPGDVDQLFKEINSKFDHLDILVNNAGINRPRDLYATTVWQEIFQVNLFAAVQCVGKAVELMTTGKILNITSYYGDGKACWKGLPAYGASKAALNHFTQVMAKNLAPNILINAIAPGYVQTPLWKDTTEAQFVENGKEQLINRMIQPEEIADMAIAILKNDAMTGEIVTVDGGISLKTI